ncbi:hypothetical protein [Moorena producens]|nr:hypothetical protein [Moorena producens]
MASNPLCQQMNFGCTAHQHQLVRWWAVLSKAIDRRSRYAIANK